MMSLASSQPLSDFDGILEDIAAGGQKAKAWLKDKVDSKFVLPGIYRPLSLIPLETWQAAPTSTNGNEQSHRNVNRDGVGLTILGGIMRGKQYDVRAMVGRTLHSSHGIYTRDQEFTHFRRSERSLNRHVVSQRRTAVRNPVPHPLASTSVVAPVVGTLNDGNVFLLDSENMVGLPIEDTGIPGEADLVPAASSPSTFYPNTQQAGEVLVLVNDPSPDSQHIVHQPIPIRACKPSLSWMESLTESSMDVDEEALLYPSAPPLPPFDPSIHLSTFSTLANALGDYTM